MDFIVLAMMLAFSVVLSVAGARLVLELALLVLWRSVERPVIGERHIAGSVSPVLTGQLSAVTIE